MSTEITKEKFSLQKLTERFDFRGRTTLIEDLLDLGSQEDGLDELKEGPRMYKEAAESADWYLLEHDDLNSLYDAVFIRRNAKHPDSSEILQLLGWEVSHKDVEVTDADGETDTVDCYTFTKGDIVREFVAGRDFSGAGIDESEPAGMILAELGVDTGELCEIDYAYDDSDGWKALCHAESIDVEPLDIYHYLEVDRSLANFLRDQGELVVEVYGMEIWARTTTGQAATIDYCIEQAAKHFFADEWNGKD
jgi:hypothetical protein